MSPRAGQAEARSASASAAVRCREMLPFRMHDIGGQPSPPRRSGPPGDQARTALNVVSVHGLGLAGVLAGNLGGVGRPIMTAARRLSPVSRGQPLAGVANELGVRAGKPNFAATAEIGFPEAHHSPQVRLGRHVRLAPEPRSVDDQTHWGAAPQPSPIARCSAPDGSSPPSWASCRAGTPPGVNER